MSQGYNVDDILEEIRRKKAQQQPEESVHTRTYADREPSERAEQPPQRPSRTESGRGSRLQDAPKSASPWGKHREPDVRAQQRGQERAPKRPAWDEREFDAPAPRGGQDVGYRSPRSEQAEQRRAARSQPAAGRFDASCGEEPPEQPVRRGAAERAGGFDFRAPGVADEQERTVRRSGNAISPDTDDFSLHFDLDEQTEETPHPAPQQHHKAVRGFDETHEMGRMGWPTAPQPKQEQRLTQSQWRQSYAEQELLEQETPDDDYADAQDAPYVAKDLKKIRIGLGVRLGLTTVLLIALAYLALSVRVFPYNELLGLKETFKLPLPEFLWPENDMRLFLLASLILSVVTTIVGSNVIGAGLMSLCRLRADADTPAALAMLAVLVQGIVLVCFPEAVLEYEQISLYFPVAAAVLLFTLIGKVMLMNRVWRNFQFLSDEKQKHAFLQIQNRDFAREFSRGLGPDISRVAYSAPSDFLSGFLTKSYSGDYSDTFAAVVAPVSLVGALLVSIVTAIFSKNAVISVSAFAAVMCICAPLSSEVVPNLMLGRMGKWLNKRGGMLAGYESAEDCAETGAVLLSDKDLFTEESVHLHGMKVFAEKRIDEAILDAASVILACDGVMSGVFLNMIGGNKALLKKVDGLIYEDGMGLSAWVDGKRVLIGSHELMRNHEIDCPSKDFESRYVRDGRKVLYIASSGELSAMFVISYNGDPRTADRLADLQRRGVSVALFATDPNMTPELIASAFNMKKSSVRVLPAKLHPEYQYLVRRKERVSAGVAHAGGLLGVLQVIRASSSVCRSVRAGTIVQLIGVIVGYGLVAVMAFINSLQAVWFMPVLFFGLIWLLITSAAASFVKS